jgi:hypothetical protein
MAQPQYRVTSDPTIGGGIATAGSFGDARELVSITSM